MHKNLSIFYLQVARSNLGRTFNSQASDAQQEPDNREIKVTIQWYNIDVEAT